MNWDAIGAVGEIVGAGAVVLTLAYLAVQMRDNTRSVRAAAFNTWSESIGGIIETMSTDERLDRILREAWTLDTATGGLDEETWMVFVVWHQRYFYHFESVWQMYRHGTLNKHIFDMEMGRVRQLLATPSVRNWWEAGGRNQVSEHLRDEIEKAGTDSHEFTWLLWDQDRGFYARDAHARSEGSAM